MPTTVDLQFIEETHEYRLKGRNIPSVSAILQDVGFVNTEYFTDEARDRGKMVHYLTAELDKAHEVEVPWSMRDTARLGPNTEMNTPSSGRG